MSSKSTHPALSVYINESWNMQTLVIIFLGIHCTEKYLSSTVFLWKTPICINIFSLGHPWQDLRNSHRRNVQVQAVRQQQVRHRRAQRKVRPGWRDVHEESHPIRRHGTLYWRSEHVIINTFPATWPTGSQALRFRRTNLIAIRHGQL